MSEWSKLLQCARAYGTEQVPAGYKSRIELQKQFSLGVAQTNKIIAQLLLSGKVECKNFKIQTRAGVRSVPHYKIT